MLTVSKGIEPGHRHKWDDITSDEDRSEGTRYECLCGAKYFEPYVNNVGMYYLREGASW